MEQAYYEVDVHGEYFAQEGEKRILRGYEATFKVPDASSPLGVIKGKLLTPFLLKRDPQYFGIYTHHIDEIRPAGGGKFDPDDIPYRFQTKEQLRIYISRHRLQISVDDYGSLGLLRDHVRLAKEEPENFVKVQTKFAQKIADDKTLHELNKEVFNTGKVGLAVKPFDGGQGVPGEKTQVTHVESHPSGQKPKNKSRKAPKATGKKIKSEGKSSENSGIEEKPDGAEGLLS